MIAPAVRRSVVVNDAAVQRATFYRGPPFVEGRIAGDSAIVQRCGMSAAAVVRRIVGDQATIQCPTECPATMVSGIACDGAAIQGAERRATALVTHDCAIVDCSGVNSAPRGRDIFSNDAVRQNGTRRFTPRTATFAKYRTYE